MKSLKLLSCVLPNRKSQKLVNDTCSIDSLMNRNSTTSTHQVKEITQVTEKSYPEWQDSIAIEQEETETFTGSIWELKHSEFFSDPRPIIVETEELLEQNGLNKKHELGLEEFTYLHSLVLGEQVSLEEVSRNWKAMNQTQSNCCGVIDHSYLIVWFSFLSRPDGIRLFTEYGVHKGLGENVKAFNQANIRRLRASAERVEYSSATLCPRYPEVLGEIVSTIHPTTDGDFESVYNTSQMRSLALVSHNQMKPTMKAFVEANKNLLKKFRLTGTNGTMTMLKEVFGDDPSVAYGRACKSGPLGGDAELVAAMCRGKLGGMIFFADPMDSHMHSVDIACLERQSLIHNIMVAVNPTTALMMCNSLRFALKEGKGELMPSFFFSLESPSVDMYIDERISLGRSDSTANLALYSSVNEQTTLSRDFSSSSLSLAANGSLTKAYNGEKEASVKREELSALGMVDFKPEPLSDESETQDSTNCPSFVSKESSTLSREPSSNSLSSFSLQNGPPMRASTRKLKESIKLRLSLLGSAEFHQELLLSEVSE